MRNLVAGFLLGFFALAGAASSNYEKSVDAVFPDEIGGLAQTRREAFPQKELGIGLTYERDGLRGSVFIYNGGLQSLPPGAGSEVVRGHFAQVVGDVKRQETTGQYRSVSLVGPAVQATGYPGCGPQFLVREFDMVTHEGQTRSSFAYLTVVRGNFVKVRFTDRGGGTRGKQHAERFVMQLRKLLGHCPV